MLTLEAFSKKVADLTMEWKMVPCLTNQGIHCCHSGGPRNPMTPLCAFGMAPSGSEQLQDPDPDQHRTSGSKDSVDLPKGDRR